MVGGIYCAPEAAMRDIDGWLNVRESGAKYPTA
jgi:hypothetical protein